MNDIYEIERVGDFFQYILDSESGLYKGFSPIGIECLFGGGFSTYTKWNPAAYPGWDTKNFPVLATEHLYLPIIPFQLQWEPNGELSSDGTNDIFKLKSYPKYCFDVSIGRYNHVKALFLKEDLVQTYLKVVKRLAECIEVACSLHQADAEAKFLAEGKKRRLLHGAIGV